MYPTLSLKEVPVEVDLAVEAAGHNPDYRKYGVAGSAFDLRRITLEVDGYSVTGLVDDGKLYIESVTAPTRLNQKTLDYLDSVDRGEVELTEHESSAALFEHLGIK